MSNLFPCQSSQSGKHSSWPTSLEGRVGGSFTHTETQAELPVSGIGHGPVTALVAHLGTRSADGNSFSVPYACELLKIGPAWCANPVLAAPASHMATGFAFFSCKLCSSFVPVFLFIGVLWNYEEDCERLAGVKSKPLGLAPSLRTWPQLGAGHPCWLRTWPQLGAPCGLLWARTWANLLSSIHPSQRSKFGGKKRKLQ